VSIWLVARVDASGAGQGRAFAFVGGLALVAVVLATTTLPHAATAAAILLLLLPLPALATERTRDVAVELAVLAVLAVELTAWAADLRSLVRETRASILQRSTQIAATVVGTAGVSAAALAAADLGGPHGRSALLLGLAGVAAAVGVLAHRARARPYDRP
jgi:hypothetical protein